MPLVFAVRNVKTFATAEYPSQQAAERELGVEFWEDWDRNYATADGRFVARLLPRRGADRFLAEAVA